MSQRSLMLMRITFPFVFSIVVGNILFFLLLPLASLNPKNISWIGSYDPMMHYLGWSFYQFGQWQNPPGLNPNYGLELSSSIVYSDAIPLVAILVKLFTNHLEYPIQYLGWWYLGCMILQTYFGYKLLTLYSNDRIIQSFGSIIFLMAPIFLWRIGEHAALAGQFMILAALYETLRHQSKLSTFTWILILCICAGINSYLLVMILAIWVACVGKNLENGQSLIALSKSCLLITISLAIALWLYGYFALSDGASSGSYGVGKMNLLAIFNSAGWSQLFSSVPEKPISTHGSDLILARMEGFNYFGAGYIALIPIAAIAAYFRRGQIKTLIGKNKLLLGCMLGLLIIAISNNISIGPINFSYSIPEKVYSLLAIVRASGRLFWPIWYLLVLALIFLIIKFYSYKLSVLILFTAIAIQLYDLIPGYKNIHQRVEIRTNRNIKQILHDPIWEIIPKCYKSIEIMPVRNHQGQDYWELIGLYASQYRMSTNAVFLARVSPTAVANTNNKYDQFGKFQSYNPATVYVVHPERIIQTLINLKKDHRLITANGLALLLPEWDNCNRKFPKETSLNLIQQVAIPPKINEKISFSKNNKGTNYLVGIGIQDQHDIGWGYPESWGAWLAGNRGLIVIPLPKDKNFKQILLTLNSIKNTGKDPSEIIIKINDQYQLEKKIQSPGINEYTIDIPKKIIDADYLSLEIIPKWRTRPKDIGIGDDTRMLSVGIISAKLK